MNCNILQFFQGISVLAPNPESRPDLDVIITRDENHNVFAVNRMNCITDAPMKEGTFVRPAASSIKTVARKLTF